MTTVEVVAATGIPKRRLIRIAHAIPLLRDRLGLPSLEPLPHPPMEWTWEDAMLARLVADLREHLMERQIVAVADVLDEGVLRRLRAPTRPLQLTIPLPSAGAIGATVQVVWDAPAVAQQMRARRPSATARARVGGGKS
jgi:hypothetical protein